MHPILVKIPLSWTTLAVLGVLFFAGGVIGARFRTKDNEASYLAALLGLNVAWGEVAKPWGAALLRGLVQGGAAAGVGLLVWKGLLGRFGLSEIPVHVYGVMMATAFIVGLWLAGRQARIEGLPAVPLRGKNGRQLVDASGKKAFITSSELVSELGFSLVLAGLAGSRVLYILTRWNDEYSHDPAKIFRIWEGGLVWYGGLIGATLTAAWFVRRHKLAFLPYADLLAPGVALGHGLGRLGCFAAGCCFGNVAMPGFPLAVQFPAGSGAFHEHLQNGLITNFAAASLPVYPTQIIEAAGELLIFSALVFLRSRKRFHGQVLLTYFILYPLLRTVIEMFRGDTIRGFFFKWPNEQAPMLLSTSQGVSILVALAGVGLTVAILRQKANARREPAAEVKAA